MKNLPTHKKWILFITLLIALGIAAPVLADYLGPNRTVTTTVSVCKVVLKECQYVEAKGEYRYHQTDSWSCSSESKPWEAYPSNSRPCNAGNKGYEYWDRDESTQQTTVTYAPATITGSIQNCTLQNGWCVTSPALALSANEPLAGYNITLIEGTLNEGLPNGTTFACPPEATSCSLPLNEGENCFAYWAHSTWGDTSDKGEICAKVDTVAPSVGLDIQGTPGALNWYVSPLTITATGADAMPGSGVASRLLSIDGGATWQPSVTLNEGVYKVDVTVADNAGNVSTSSATLSVDTTTPTIEVAVSGTLGKNNYYTSVLQVAGDPKDATSGVAAFEVAVDGAAYQAYTAPISFSDGQHTIQFKACDVAGNCTETPQQTFLVDTIPPQVNLPASWQLGTNVPYDVLDEGSGLAALRIVIEDEDEKYAKVAWDQAVSGHTFSQDIDWNGEFKDKTVAPPGTYLVWIKASDLAGNEKFYLGKVIVPQPNVFLNLLPTEEPAISASPVPPAELFEPEAVLPVTAPPTTDFGGETTETTGITTHSLLLATGTAGAAAATTSGVLWGAAAAAAIGAATVYALDATRKRKEAEAAQGQKERAEKRLTKSEKAERARAHDQKVQERKEQQAWANPAKEKALLKEQEERDRAYQQQLQQQRLEQQMREEAARQAASNARIEKKIARFDAQEEANWLAAQAALQKKQEDQKMTEAAARNAGMLANLPGYFNSEKQAPAEKPWWEKAASFVQEKIVQPAAQSTFVRKVVLPISIAALAVTGTANTYQWYQDVTKNPHLFDNVRQTMVEQLQTQAPSFFLDRDTKWQILLSDPYAAVHDSVETLNIFLSGAANAIDTVWQQNPAVREIAKDMKIAADVACSQVKSEAWQRRCIGLTYHTTAFVEHPADSLLGLGESVVIYPMEGLIKTGVFLTQYESVSLGKDLLHGWQENGWQGLMSAAANHVVPFGQLVLTDPQVQSFLIVAGILELLVVASLLAVPALVTASVLGLAAVIQTAWGAWGIDQTIQQLPNLQSVKEYVASHPVRTFTITSLFILALAALGVTKGVSDLQSFNGSLSPAAQESFASRSWWNQLQLVDAAKAAKASPGAINFYLEHSTSGDGRLAGLPIPEALHVSSLAEQSGKGGFLLDYVARHGSDPAAMNTLLNTSPQALTRYANLAKLPNSLLNQITPQQGLNIINGKVVQVDPAMAVNLAAEIAKATGKDAWGSPVTGQMYFPESSPRAWAAGSQLIEIIKQTPDQIGDAEARALMQIISEESYRGKGNRFQLGPFMVKDSVTNKVIPTAGVERGVYIQDALNKGVNFYDMGDVYYALRDALKDAGFPKPDEQLWPINEGTLQSVMESKTPIEFVYTDIDVELNRWKDTADSEVPIRIRELRWIKAHADEYDYIRDGNRWIWEPNP